MDQKKSSVNVHENVKVCKNFRKLGVEDKSEEGHDCVSSF